MASSSSGSSRAVAFLLIGLIASVSAVVVLYRLIEQYQDRIAEAQKPEETITVMVAARELFQGVMITEEDVRPVEVPPAYLPAADAVGLYYNSPQQVIGRTPRERILPNEFVRPDRLADVETGTGLNAIIPPNMRAISVAIKDGQALAGLLNARDYVDVVVTIEPEDDANAPQTRTLLQAVYVLAVNDQADLHAKKAEEDGSRSRNKKRKARVKPTVTLAVFPDQAEQIAHAEKEGEITLTLRNSQDREFSEREDPTDINTILGITPEPEPEPKVNRPRPPVAVAEPEPESATLQVSRGSKTEFVEIDEQVEEKPKTP